MAKTDALQRLKEFKELKGLPAQLLVLVPDEARRTRLLDALIDIVRQTVGAQLEVRRIRADELRVAEYDRLRDDVASVSLFSPQRVFVVQGIDQVKAEQARRLLDLTRVAPPGTSVIFSGATLPERSTIRTAFEKEQGLLELKELKGVELKRWVERELRSVGVTLADERVVEALIEMTGESPERIAARVQHLALYSDGNPITLRDLAALFSNEISANDFELLDAVTAGNVARIEVLLHEVLQSGRSPFLLLSMFSRTFSALERMSLLLASRLAPGEVRDQLGLRPFVFNKYLPLVKRYPLEKLRSCTESILEADSRLKGRAVSQSAVLEQLCLSLTP